MSDRLAEIGAKVADSLRIDYGVERDLSASKLENKVLDFLERHNLTSKIEKLDPEQRTNVVNGISALWAINTNGKEIEEKDRNIIGNAESGQAGDKEIVREKVEGELRKISDANHGQYDWFDTAVTLLVETASKPVPEDMVGGKREVLDLTAKYVHSLEMASQTYGKLSTQLSWAKKAVDVSNYLNGTREEKLGLMKSTRNLQLSESVSKIKPSKTEE